MDINQADIVLELPDYGLLKVSGSDAKKLLQGQLSCDIEKITPETGSMAVHCTPQGRIISLFYILLLDGNYYLIMPASMIRTEIDALSKYSRFYKTEVTDATGSLNIIGILGNEHDLCEINGNYAFFRFPANFARKIMIGDISPKTPAKTHTISIWHLHDLQEGIPAVYPETSGKFLPHELNLPSLNAISFDKGCYTGQEIIARMHYRGSLKKNMKIASSTAPANPGSEVYLQSDNSKAIGTIVDCGMEPGHDKYILLVILDEKMAENSNLLTETGEPIAPLTSERR